MRFKIFQYFGRRHRGIKVRLQPLHPFQKTHHLFSGPCPELQNQTDVSHFLKRKAGFLSRLIISDALFIKPQDSSGCRHWSHGWLNRLRDTWDPHTEHSIDPLTEYLKLTPLSVLTQSWGILWKLPQHAERQKIQQIQEEATQRPN